MNEFLLILGMMLVTFGVRYPTLALLGRLELAPPIVRALRYVPVAVLSAIIAPMMLFRDEMIVVSYTNPYLVGGVVAIVVSYWTKNVTLTIVSGLIFFFVYRALIGV